MCFANLPSLSLAYLFMILTVSFEEQNIFYFDVVQFVNFFLWRLMHFVSYLRNLSSAQGHKVLLFFFNKCFGFYIWAYDPFQVDFCIRCEVQIKSFFVHWGGVVDMDLFKNVLVPSIRLSLLNHLFH